MQFSSKQFIFHEDMQSAWKSNFCFHFFIRDLLVHQGYQDLRYFPSFADGDWSCFVFLSVHLWILRADKIYFLQGNMGLNFQGPKGEKVSRWW